MFGHVSYVWASATCLNHQARDALRELQEQSDPDRLAQQQQVRHLHRRASLSKPCGPPVRALPLYAPHMRLTCASHAPHMSRGGQVIASLFKEVREQKAHVADLEAALSLGSKFGDDALGDVGLAGEDGTDRPVQWD